METRSWVKTSLAPGSRVVVRLPRPGGAQPYLDRLHFNLVGYGCTTCIGNSGPLPEEVAEEITERSGRSRPCYRETATSRRASIPRFAPTTSHRRRWWWLMRWPAASTVDLTSEPMGNDRDGRPVYLSEIWPTAEEVERPFEAPSAPTCSRRSTAASSTATSAGATCRCRRASCSTGMTHSTYVREATFFERPSRPFGHRRRAGAGAAGRFGHHRSHLARPGRSRRRPRPADT